MFSRHSSTILFLLAFGLILPRLSFAQVVINEISYNADPDALPDPEDWLELYNRGNSAADLEDWQLVDGNSNVFPLPSRVLQPGQYLILSQIRSSFLIAFPGVDPNIVIGDFGPIQGGLENNGEQLRLLNETLNIADIVTYGDGPKWGQESDGDGSTLSLRDPSANNTNHPENWGASVTLRGTPGAPNGNLFPKINILVPVDGGPPFINPSSIAISGECEDPGGSVSQIEIYYDFVNVVDPLKLVGTTSCGGGGTYSLNWNSPPTGFIELKAEAIDNNSARSSSNKPDIEIFASDPCIPAPTPLVINEINYNSALVPDPKDWIEIYNPTSSIVDAAAWKIKDETDSGLYGFPSGTTIPARGYLIVSKSKLTFQAVFPGLSNVIGDISFGFGSNDEVRLLSPTDCLVDFVDYDNDFPWPTSPDGTGPTLVLRDPSLDNSLPESWAASGGNGSPLATNGFLPVELSSFTADLQDRDVLLAWTTISEDNNAGFEVQMSNENAGFELLSFVDGHGTTTERQDYEFTIQDLEPGLNRFRLKQIDFDGAFEYSPIVEIITDMADAFVLYPAYPNPFNPSTSIRFGARERGDAVVQLFDMQGRLQKMLFEGSLRAGELVQVSVDASDLAGGTYFVRFVSLDQSLVQTITLLK